MTNNYSRPSLDFNKINEGNINYVVNYYNVERNEYGKIKCVRPEHEDKNPSSSITPDNQRIYCFSCGKVTNIIKLVQIKEKENGNILDYYEAAKLAKEILENSDNKGSNITHAVNNNTENNKKTVTFNARKNFCKNSKEEDINIYLEKRGILPNNLRYLHELLKLQPTGIQLGSDSFGQFHIFFNKFEYCIYRNKKEDKNFNCGKSTPTTIRTGSDELVIVEGIFDALSLIQFKEFNLDVCSLNSVSNRDFYVKEIKKSIKQVERKYKRIYLVLDKDEPGDEATNDMLHKLKALTNKIDIIDYRHCFGAKYKDINEHITVEKNIDFKIIDTSNIKVEKDELFDVVISCANRIKNRLEMERVIELDNSYDFENYVESLLESQKLMEVDDIYDFEDEVDTQRTRQFEEFLNDNEHDDLYYNELIEDLIREQKENDIIAEQTI